MGYEHRRGFLKRIRYRGEWIAIRGMARAIPILPRRVLGFVADTFGAVAAYVYLPGRRVALQNLECALPEMTASRRKRLVRQSYQHFARAQLDLFWSPRLTSENVRDYFDLQDLDRLQREQGDRGYIFACLHYGGFEWIAVVLGLCGIKCTVVTQAFKNALLDQTFNSLREVSGHQTIRREGALLRLVKALKAGRSVVFAVDLTISPRLPSVPIRCFGMETCITVAHPFLHQQSGAPIIPTCCEPMRDGRYRLVLGGPLEFPADATPQEIAQACWDSLEPLVRQNPAPWLWMYKHWRYRPAGTTRAYPDYANESPYFEELLQTMRNEKAQPVAN